MSGLPTRRERSDGASALMVIVRSVNVALYHWMGSLLRRKTRRITGLCPRILR
ncbi:MAG: hypothetical protein ACLP0J_10460 [Solirubrobacteraceae bacterium]